MLLFVDVGLFWEILYELIRIDRSFTLKIEVECSSETFVAIHETTRRRKPEE